jgi:peptidoglycan DL-endopeptidase CwlO
MKKQKLKETGFLSRFTTVQLYVVATVLTLGAVGVPVVSANLQQQINKLQKQNSKKADAKYQLGLQAVNLNDKISKLREQITVLQGQIQANEAKNEALRQEIVAAEAELAKQKNLLGQNIKAMYLEGQITTIEMLASSRNLSEFVDKQQYRDAVKDKIKETLDKITALKLKLKGQKESVEKLIKEQQLMQAQLDEQRSEQNRLLALNYNQRDALDAEIKQNAERIAELQRQQVLENARLFGGRVPPGVPGGGGYAWGDAICMHPGFADPPCGQYDWGYPNYGIYDQWGYGYRNCTSYVAWKVNQRQGRMVSGLGHAKHWPFNIGSRGEVSYGQGARVGDAAVSTGGTYGHVMYVEAVEGDTVYVSDYNFGGDGYYRPPRPIKQSGLYFIHF